MCTLSQIEYDLAGQVGRIRGEIVPLGHAVEDQVKIPKIVTAKRISFSFCQQKIQTEVTVGKHPGQRSVRTAGADADVTAVRLPDKVVHSRLPGLGDLDLGNIFGHDHGFQLRLPVHRKRIGRFIADNGSVLLPAVKDIALVGQRGQLDLGHPWSGRGQLGRGLPAGQLHFAMFGRYGKIQFCRFYSGIFKAHDSMTIRRKTFGRFVIGKFQHIAGRNFQLN